MEKMNRMCADCLKLGKECNGTTCQTWTGCVYRVTILDEMKRQAAEINRQKAEAIKTVQQATADGIRMVREAGADNAVLTLQAFEALKAVANGRATKLIIPSEIQGMAGLAASLKEIVADDKQ